MADESQAIAIARNHAIDNNRNVLMGFRPNGAVHVLIGEDYRAEHGNTGYRELANAAGVDALETVNRAIAEADTFAHHRDHQPIRKLARENPADGSPIAHDPPITVTSDPNAAPTADERQADDEAQRSPELERFTLEELGAPADLGEGPE